MSVVGIDLSTRALEWVRCELEGGTAWERTLQVRELERTALGWVLNGETYAGSREVDNAIQRARRKLRSAAAAV